VTVPVITAPESPDPCAEGTQTPPDREISAQQGPTPKSLGLPGPKRHQSSADSWPERTAPRRFARSLHRARTSGVPGRIFLFSCSEGIAHSHLTFSYDARSYASVLTVQVSEVTLLRSMMILRCSADLLIRACASGNHHPPKLDLISLPCTRSNLPTHPATPQSCHVGSRPRQIPRPANPGWRRQTA
jgi:hypothetical protein